LYPLVFLCLLFPFLSGCEPDSPILRDQDLYDIQLPAGFPEMPQPADNQLTQSRVKLGEMLFFDPMLSRDYSISCGSCHFQENGFADPVALSEGVEGRKGLRNASSLINLAWNETFFRDGGVRTLELQVLAPIIDFNEMDFTIPGVVERMNNNPEYVQLARAAYGRNPDAFVLTRAISAFERTLVSGNSAWDRYSQFNEENALTESAKRGKDLFFSSQTNCSNCHSGFNFTNFDFENNGRYVQGGDSGRMRVTLDPADRGKFIVPTLRNVAESFPYMHDGSLATLEDVIEHYNQGGMPQTNLSPLIRPLNLTVQEKADLKAFLESLSDPEFLGQ
jgi:cytochrome c peroxidase